jgi:hypothetical protein
MRDELASGRASAGGPVWKYTEELHNVDKISNGVIVLLVIQATSSFAFDPMEGLSEKTLW